MRRLFISRESRDVQEECRGFAARERGRVGIYRVSAKISLYVSFILLF